MFKTAAIVIVLALAALVGAVLVIATTRPDQFRVERRITIGAPSGAVHALIDDFRRWPAWSPYESDPAMERTYGGTERGTGATYAWSSSGKAGAGRMEITESTPASRVAIQLDFTRPLETRNQVVFELVPQGNFTDVTWRMEGPSPYVSKIMQVVFDLDTVIGDDFDTGLARLKAAAEGRQPAP